MQQNHKFFDEEFDLLKLVQSIAKYWYLVLGWIIFCLVIAGFYLFTVNPTYRADALIQVEKKNSGAILTASLDSLLETSSEIKDEIELLRSRKVIGAVIEKLDLTTDIKRVKIPIIGSFLAIFESNKPKVDINYFQVTEELLSEKFILVAINNQQYDFFLNGSKLFTGVTNQKYQESGITIEVAKLQYAENVQFEISKKIWIVTHTDLIRRLATKQDGKGSEVLRISFDSTSPSFAKTVLDEIIISYQQQGIDRQAEEIDSTLFFLQGKLPEIADLQRDAENKFNQYRQSEKSVDLSLETKSILEQITQLELQLQELRLKETEISKLYTKQHPVYRSLQEQISSLRQRQDQLSEQVKKMPATQQEVLRLMQNVQVNKERYVALQNKEQELRVLRAGVIGNVRIIDAALTNPIAVAPKKILIVALAFFLGGLLSLIHVSFEMLLRRKNIKSANDVERLGVEVLCCIQKDAWLVAQQEKNKKNNKNTQQVLAKDKPDSIAIESLRSLKTSLYLKLLSIGEKSPIVMISGASPSAGKSFVSLNLAYVITENQKQNKVLLIDADMRLGHIHEAMGLNISLGLSDYLEGICDLGPIIQQYDNIDFIACGSKRKNTYSTSLLMQSGSKNSLQALLDWAGKEEYSMIIIDTPPVLALSDAILIGNRATLNLLVINHSKDSLRNVDECLKRFNSNKIDIAGCVLNYYDEKEAGSEAYTNYQYHYLAD